MKIYFGYFLLKQCIKGLCKCCFSWESQNISQTWSFHWQATSKLRYALPMENIKGFRNESSGVPLHQRVYGTEPCRLNDSATAKNFPVMHYLSFLNQTDVFTPKYDRWCAMKQITPQDAHEKCVNCNYFWSLRTRYCIFIELNTDLSLAMVEVHQRDGSCKKSKIVAVLPFSFSFKIEYSYTEHRGHTYIFIHLCSSAQLIGLLICKNACYFWVLLTGLL